ncbi:type II secretion system F family protein [Candidatus Omnitrophota bacterium]
MSFIPYLIFALIFSSIFIVVSQYFFFKEKQKFIQERFASTLKTKDKRTFAFKPLFKPLATINSRIGSKSLREGLGHRLVSAGSPLSVDEFFVFKELAILFLPLVLALLIGWQKVLSNPILVVISCIGGFAIPDIWLKNRIEKRKREVLRCLPNIIDLLILAVDAGLDFMIAVRRVVQRSKPGPIVDELFQLWQEVQIGRVRREALRNMAKRWNISEVNSFVRTLIQAERMGTPMGEALRALSEEIRMRQFQRGEQQALKAPIKMLFPLLFCILPVVIIMVGGPVFLQFASQGITFLK